MCNFNTSKRVKYVDLLPLGGLRCKPTDVSYLLRKFYQSIFLFEFISFLQYVLCYLTIHAFIEFPLMSVASLKKKKITGEKNQSCSKLQTTKSNPLALSHWATSILSLNGLFESLFKIMCGMRLCVVSQTNVLNQ